MIKVGDNIPAGNITVINKAGEDTVQANDYFANKPAFQLMIPSS